MWMDVGEWGAVAGNKLSCYLMDGRISVSFRRKSGFVVGMQKGAELMVSKEKDCLPSLPDDE
jgi:hypothetical protein